MNVSTEPGCGAMTVIGNPSSSSCFWSHLDQIRESSLEKPFVASDGIGSDVAHECTISVKVQEVPLPREVKVLRSIELGLSTPLVYQ